MTLFARTKPGVPLNPTGSTRHYEDGVLIGGIVRLEIVEDDGGFYLFHFDINDRNVIDTWHDTIGEAVEQAAFECGLDHSAWDFSPFGAP